MVPYYTALCSKKRLIKISPCIVFHETPTPYATIKLHFMTHTILWRGFIFCIISGFFLAGAFLLWAATLNTPDLKSFDTRKVTQSTKIFDRTGEVPLYELHDSVKRTVIPFDEISRDIKNATVAIEDAEFYQHKGVKPQAILRAVLVNIVSLEYSQGGSTITQQVIKNSVLSQEKSISRKLKEWVLAIKLEQSYTKDQILEFYLNESPYGGNIYGVEEASERFFGKSASDLSLVESAYLAALPQAPTYYSPYGNNREKLDARKNLVLSKMYENGFITEEEYNSAKTTTLDFKQQTDSGIKAPHFVFFVQEYLESKYGQRAIEERGFRVITTLDYDLQKKAEEVVKKYALENAEKFNASNASLVAVDPRTGQILTMVGSRDYFDEKIDGNFNVALAHRQPGSAFKPFAYAEALLKGYTSESVVFDVRTQFSTACSPDNLTTGGDCYSPTNYDNIFRGPVTFRNALAQSINIPAIKVLYLAGLKDTLRLAEGMGVQSLGDISQYGLTLVLGGGEVSLLDMTSAYGVFANNGVRNPYTGILRIEDSAGNVVEDFTLASRRVLDEGVSHTISDMLSDNVARTPAFGANSGLYFPGRSVAAKTGTTNEYKDAWIIGYTPSFAAGAWAGNNDNTPMEKKVAGFIVAPMWNEFMRYALQKYPEEAFPTPPPISGEIKPILRGKWQGGESILIDKLTRKRATEYTPAELTEERIITSIHSILYWVDKSNPLGPYPSNPANDPQFRYWERGVLAWKNSMGIVDETEYVIPTETDTVHTRENMPTIAVISPSQNQVFKEGEGMLIIPQVSGKFPISEVQYYVNNVNIGSSNKEPFQLLIIPSSIPSISTYNTLRVVVYDAVRNKNETSVSFTVNK